MANMSASILRNVVASVFKIRPESVILSGELEPTRSFTGHDCWSSQSNTYSFKLWGFSPVKGFVDLNQYVGCSRNSTSGENYGDEGTQLMHIPGVEEFVFFLVNEDFTSGNGRDYDSFTWTLYKAPNFAQKWAEIEEADVKRWNTWLDGKLLKGESIQLDVQLLDGESLSKACDRVALSIGANWWSNESKYGNQTYFEKK